MGNITYKFEEFTSHELDKIKAKSQLNKLRIEKQKENELKDKIKNIKKKQEEQIAKYIGDVELTNAEVEQVVNREDDFDNCRVAESTQIEALLRSNRETSDINQFKLARADIVYKKPRINQNNGDESESEDEVTHFDKYISFSKSKKKSMKDDISSDEEETNNKSKTTFGKFNVVKRAIKRKNEDYKDEDNILKLVSSSTKRVKTSEVAEKKAEEKKPESNIIQKSALSALLPYGSD
eukprot:CAMPEP_0205807316 /NCGR_PEP_ID=MMETSP0205-20121125/11040_1 /ASSEMBLY_ACC=CAM_ASM_000278 /TAXON_ID=36767 /ORGANISM="Euplotes focardii, Strain TN1" /LENGTH=236 /DNA_ID=CAMNT_0053081413 /DNA_START=24 /DNA_END=731 /DNA_ORIENTATION=+